MPLKILRTPKINNDVFGLAAHRVADLCEIALGANDDDRQ
jgi:hypothetical protein